MPRSMMTPPKPEDMNEIPRLEAEGWFHFLVKDYKDGERPGGKAAEGFLVDLQVLEGEHEGQTISLFLQDGSPSHKDGGEFCNKRQCSFLVAANVITIDALSAGEAFSYELDHSRGQQVVARLKFGKETGGDSTTDPPTPPKRFLDFDGLKIHHVDDPRSSDVKKNAEALALIPKELRRPAEYFAPLIGTSGGGGGKKNDPPAAAAPEFDPSGL